MNEKGKTSKRQKWQDEIEQMKRTNAIVEFQINEMIKKQFRDKYAKQFENQTAFGY